MKKIRRSTMMALTAACGICALSSTALAEEHLNFGCYVYATSFDPAAYQNAAWQTMRWGIGETLFRFQDDASIEYRICDSYESSEDKMTWTLHIRDGILFSNGDVCDAQAVSDSLNRLFNVCEGTDYSSTPRNYLDVASIEADSESGNVIIKTKKPYADIAGPLCFPFYTIIDVYGDVTDAEHPDGYGTEIVSAGPYKLDYFDELSKSGGVVKNEYYWDGEVPYDSITETFIEDDTTKAMALQSGDIDLTENITTVSDLDNLKNDDSFYVSQKTSARTSFCLMNQKGILADKNLREAILMGIDSQTLCDVTVGGMYTAGIGILPSNLIYEDENLNNPYTYDQEKAQKLLDESGIIDTDGDGIREYNGENLNLKFLTYKNRCLSDFAEAIQVQLGQIGIGVDVQVTDSDTLWMMTQAGDYDLSNSCWLTVGVGDPTSFLSNWYGGNGSNLFSEENENGTNQCGYDSPEYNELYEKLVDSLDMDERNDLIVQLEQTLIDDAAVIVHGYYNSTMISNASKVKGAEISTFDYYWIEPSIQPVQ